MYFTNKKLSETIIDALQKAEITFEEKSDRWLIHALPQMDKSDYTIFKKILSEIDGKWSKKLDAHFFDSDPTALIQEVIAVGCLPQRKPHEAFFTPSVVTEELLQWGNFYLFEGYESYKFLEPQAGKGNIVEVLREKYPKIQIDCCEIDEVNRAALKRKNFKVIGDNFLLLPVDPTYRWVIMNPPFNGKKGDYIDHISHAFKFLKENGTLLAIAPESFLKSKDKKTVDFRNWVFTYGSHARLPEKCFAKSGTNINCIMLKIDKFSDEQIKEYESLESFSNPSDIYTSQIIINLETESEWDKQFCRVVDLVRGKKINSKEKLFNEFIRCADGFVQDYIYKYEANLRWDSFTKYRLAEYFYEYMIREFFKGRSSFEETVKITAHPGKENAGNFSAKPGYVDWLIALKLEMQSVLHNINFDVQQIKAWLKLFQENSGFEVLVKNLNGDKFNSWEEFCETKEPFGLGCSLVKLKKILAILEES
jgi:hypothetical protein